MSTARASPESEDRDGGALRARAGGPGRAQGEHRHGQGSDAGEAHRDNYYEVLVHDPHNPGRTEQLAGLLYGAGRLAEASQVLEEGLRLDPGAGRPASAAGRWPSVAVIARRRWTG